MVTPQDFRDLALQLHDSSESPHFEKASFRARKKIFATLEEAKGTATLKLTGMQQAAFCSWDITACFPVPGKWGLQGWTTVVLEKIPSDFAKDILTQAHANVTSR